MKSNILRVLGILLFLFPLFQFHLYSQVTENHAIPPVNDENLELLKNCLTSNKWSRTVITKKYTGTDSDTTNNIQFIVANKNYFTIDGEPPLSNKWDLRKSKFERTNKPCYVLIMGMLRYHLEYDSCQKSIKFDNQKIYNAHLKKKVYLKNMEYGANN